MSVITRHRATTLGVEFVLGRFDQVTRPPASSAEWIEPKATMKCDQPPSSIKVPQDAGRRPVTARVESPQEKDDRRAVERGENEGMLVDSG